MYKLFAAPILLAGIIIATPAFAETSPDLPDKDDKLFCSKSLFLHRRSHLRIGKWNGELHAAYAAAYDFSITGIRGCAWSGRQNSQEEAFSAAIELCKKEARRPENCKVLDYFRFDP